MTDITERELATLLYALHRYQQQDIDTPGDYAQLSAAGFDRNHFHTHIPLNPDEVDVLCLKLSAKPAADIGHLLCETCGRPCSPTDTLHWFGNCMKEGGVASGLRITMANGKEIDDLAAKILDMGVEYAHGIIRKPGETDADLCHRMRESIESTKRPR
jgi:hypothetical protein